MVAVDRIHALLAQPFDETNLPLAGMSRGKVRDSYPLPGSKRLLVTTDRLSAFDRVLAAVPYKGQVLNQLSAWWFEQTREIIANHLISVPDPNAAVVIEAEPLSVEVIVRGYITGVTKTALWYLYSLGERQIYGHLFPEGLRKNQALPRPIITPTTKGGPTGHDERLTCAEVVGKGYLDAATWYRVMDSALAIFQLGQETASRAGLILVDTKYEFGRAPGGEIVLIDEVHTPDSSRFWKEASYESRFVDGQEPELFDKEFIRLAYVDRGYRGDGEPPAMQDSLWVEASQLYISIYEQLTRQEFVPASYPAEPRLVENLRKAGHLS